MSQIPSGAHSALTYPALSGETIGFYLPALPTRHYGFIIGIVSQAFSFSLLFLADESLINQSVEIRCSRLSRPIPPSFKPYRYRHIPPRGLITGIYMSSEASRQQHHDNHRSSPPTLTSTQTKTGKLALLAILTAILAVLIALCYGDSDNLFGFRSLFRPSSSIARSVGGGVSKSASSFASAGTAAAAATIATTAAAASTPKSPVHRQQTEGSSSKMNTIKTPVYFLSHGGVSGLPFHSLPSIISIPYYIHTILFYPESEYANLTHTSQI